MTIPNSPSRPGPGALTASLLKNGVFRWSIPLLFLLLSGAVLLDSGAVLDRGSDFTLTAVDGRAHSLSDYRGKWVVVNYWATWCPPCRAEVPDLVRFHEAHKDKDAVVLGVNMDDPASHEQLSRFIRDHGMTYPVLRQSPVAALGPVPGLPTTYLVAPDGTVAGWETGVVTRAEIESFMNSYQPAR